MEQSISTRKAASKKVLETKAPRVNEYDMQPGDALAGQLNHDKPHWTNPATGSGLSCKLC